MADEVETVAIVGMAGKFPGAANIDEFWQNILAGKASITRFDEKELLENGISQAELNNPNYVKTKGWLAEADCFDAEFFGYTPREAELMDPQHRVLLETVYAALEDVGCNPMTFEGDIGVFASASQNSYLLRHLAQDTTLLNDANYYQVVLGNGNDFLATRISYKLNLRGPAQTIQTGCSSSLVAVHYACQSLLNYECDVAVVGGVSITTPLKSGYLYKKEGIASPNGQCRPFDAEANGTLPGNGCGVVVLKRLSDARENQDRIYANIKGSAINNDGNNKVGYTAPSVSGQAKAIQMAQAVANVAPSSIHYIEAHGTGTRMGDPIEIAGLVRAFGKQEKQQWCAIGSLKGNVGHLDAAAGVAGLMKTALSLYHQTIPPSGNFSSANPDIDFEHSPFFVNSEARSWTRDKTPRRAGVSAFGIGGTNAHAILEEELQPLVQSDQEWHLLPISAKTPAALAELREQFIKYLETHPDLNLANAAYTLQTRRMTHAERSILICRKETGKIQIGAIDDLLAEQQVYAKAWLSGEEVTSALSNNSALSVTTLPTYPFARIVHWLPVKYPAPIASPKQENKEEDLETKFARILQMLLGVETVSWEENFTDIGADSLMLIDFVVEVEQQCQVTIPTGVIAEYFSIVRLAEYLRQKERAPAQEKSTSSAVLPFHPPKPPLRLVEKTAILIKEGDKQKPPLFCIHPAGGAISVFQGLALHLDVNQSVIGIRAMHANGATNASITAMARRYKEVIQDAQGEGPYLLCGSSMGGTVAFEMAQMFQQEGQKVSLLAMLDTPSPGMAFDTIPSSNQEILDYIATLSPETAKGLSREEEQFFDLWRAHCGALMDYRGNPYSGQIVYFKAKELKSFLTRSLEQGWIPLAEEGIEIHEVPGNHITIHTTPHVKRIADVINRKLQLIAMQQSLPHLTSIPQKRGYSYA